MVQTAGARFSFELEVLAAVGVTAKDAQVRGAGNLAVERGGQIADSVSARVGLPGAKVEFQFGLPSPPGPDSPCSQTPSNFQRPKTAITRRIDPPPVKRPDCLPKGQFEWTDRRNNWFPAVYADSTSARDGGRKALRTSPSFFQQTRSREL